MAGINAWISTFGDYLQTAQVMSPAGFMPDSDIPLAWKIAVRQAEDRAVAIGR
jgi:hypothetical protein